ncbi:MAG: hypothetical protein U0791_20295 [Gemmataceae bacterium]
MKRYLFALAVAAGGSLPFAAADEPKPKPAVEGVKKPAPDSEKKPVKASRLTGRIGKIDAANKSLVLVRKGDGRLREDTFALAADATVLIDGKPGKLDALKADMTVELATAGEGKPITEVRATGQKLNGIVKATTADSLTFGTKEDRTVKLAEGAKVLIQGKAAKLTDLAVGTKIFVQLTADESAALLVTDGAPAGGVKKPEGDKPGVKKPEGDKPGVKKPDGDKPGVKPEKPVEK